MKNSQINHYFNEWKSQIWLKNEHDTKKIQNTNWKWMKNPKLAICKWMEKTQNTSRKCMENQQRKWTRDVSLRWTQFKKKIVINVHFWTQPVSFFFSLCQLL